MFPEYWSCDQGDADGCCTEQFPCDAGEGDCDSSDECRGDLVCGTDNCVGGNFHDGDDCCERIGGGNKVGRKI